MWRRKKGRKEENVVREDSFFAHRITSDAHLLWAVKQGCAQAYLTVLSAWKPPHFYAGAMVLVKAWVKGGLKCRVCYPLCFFSVRVAASLALGPRQWFLLRKSELGLSAAGLVHSRPELPDQVGGKYCVSSSGEGLPFHCLLRGEEEETGLSTASDLGFASKSEKSSGLEIALITMGPSCSWCTRELHLPLRAETKVIYTFPPSSTFSIWTVIFWVIFGEGMPLLTPQSLGIIFITNSV